MASLVTSFLSAIFLVIRVYTLLGMSYIVLVEIAGYEVIGIFYLLPFFEVVTY